MRPYLATSWARSDEEKDSTIPSSGYAQPSSGYEQPSSGYEQRYGGGSITFPFRALRPAPANVPNSDGGPVYEATRTRFWYQFPLSFA